MEGSFCNVGALVMLLIAMGAGALSGATREWYVISLPGTKNSIGLFEECTETTAGTTCATLDFNALVAPLQTACDRKADDVRMRFDATAALDIIAILIALAAFVAAVAMRKHRHATHIRVLSVLLPFVACIFFTMSNAIFVHTMDNWLFCGVTFCEHYADSVSSCDDAFGFSYMLFCAAPLAAMVACIASAYLLRVNPVAESEEEEEDEEKSEDGGTPQTQSPQQEPASPGSASPPTQPQQQQHRKNGPPAGTPAPPAGEDWEWDPNTELYWSDSNALFLDTNSYQYYDPDSQQWYDPASESWYS